MPHTAFSLPRLVAIADLVIVALPAFATSQRTFVESNGNDTNPCTIVAPCRGFAAAIAATLSNGEIIVLDSAGYGGVTIDKPLSIIAPAGVYAGVSVFSGNDGITVNAGATDRVVLRGITINGQGGAYGIRVTSGGEIHIEDCTVANMQESGILVEGGSAVHIARTVVRSSFNSGVLVLPAAAVAITVTVADSILTSNGNMGFWAITTAGGTLETAVTRVTSSANGSTGFRAEAIDAAGRVAMALVDSISTKNQLQGVAAGGMDTTVMVSGSSLVRNGGPDLYQSGAAVLRSAGNNALSGRGVADISGTVTTHPLN
jgi:hypothetical protein